METIGQDSRVGVTDSVSISRNTLVIQDVIIKNLVIEAEILPLGLDVVVINGVVVHLETLLGAVFGDGVTEESTRDTIINTLLVTELESDIL